MDFANTYEDFGIPFVDVMKKNAENEVYVVCPTCSPYRKSEHQHEKKLAVNVAKGTWCCQHCRWTGGLTPSDWVKDKPRLATAEFQPLTDKQVAYWKNRGISEATLNACGVRSRTKSIKDKKTGQMMERLCNAFIYTQNGWKMMIKYRDGYKNFGMELGGKLIPWGLDYIRNSKTCIIVEGEPDRLSYFEVGEIYVVSVPNGATISPEEKKEFEATGKLNDTNTLSLSYFDNCYEYFDNKTTIYIATDADAAGIKLRYEIGRRFGFDRCKFVDFSRYEYPNEESKVTKCKDANDVLRYIGKEALKKTIEQAENFPIDDVITIDDVWDNIMFQFDKGLDYGKSTGIRSLDAHFNWKIGHSIVLNGHNNMGKTHFGINLILLSCILYDWKWGIYTPENYPVEDIAVILLEIYMGNTMDKTKEKPATKEQVEFARNFIRSHIEFVNNENGYTPSKLREVKKQMIVRRGIRGFFTDPWNSLLHSLKNRTLDDFLTEELSAEVRFAVNNKIINLFGTHPQTPYKIEEKREPMPPTEFEITGGAIWSKKMYEILTIHYDKSLVGEKEPPPSQIYVHKTKDHRLVGIPTKNVPVLLKFNRRNHRYLLSNGEDPIDKAKRTARQETFNWESF